MKAERKSKPAGNARRIPTEPTVVYCRKLQSQDFTDGAYAFAEALAELNNYRCEERPTEHKLTAAIAQAIEKLIDAGGETRAGALAAVAHWFAMTIDGCTPYPQNWQPLESTFDGDECDRYADPHPLAELYEVAGEPVTVMPDMITQRWSKERDVCGHEDVSIELVRAIGKPISRKRFDNLRAKTEPRQ